MKKPLLFILSMLLFSMFSFSSVIRAWDFEDQSKESWSAWSPATAAVVTNPNKTGNTSAYVLEYNQTVEGWKGVARWQDPTILSSEIKSISVDVYIVDASGLVQLYMDNSTSGASNSTNKQFTGIAANTWTTAVFDVSDLAVLDYKQFAFQCDVKGVIYLDNIKLLSGQNSVKKVIARETFGLTAFDTNGPAQTIGFATHFKATDITGFTSTNGSITGGSDNSVRLNNYDNTLAVPSYWREPSGGMHAHLAIRTSDAYKGSWDTLYYNGVDISMAYSVSAIEFGYVRARGVVDTIHTSLNVKYRVDGGEWIQADTTLIKPRNVVGKWDYIVMPVKLTGQTLDIMFASVQENEQFYLDDITVEAEVPNFELVENVITRETFGLTAFDTNGPAQTSGFATHYKATDITGFTSANGSITGGSDNSVRLNNYDNTLAIPTYWREPSGGMHAHLAIRTGDSYKGSWDTLYYSAIDISSAFAVSSLEFGYVRARGVVDTIHTSLNVKYRVDGGAWIQADTSLIKPRNVVGKWDYIVMPVKLSGQKLDIMFASVQENEQFYLDDITVVGKVEAPAGVNDFVVENVIVGTIDSPEDYTCDLNLKWDADNVYLKLTIADDSIVATGTAYQVDNIEVYFDMDNSKNIHWPRNGGWISGDPTYDDNDFQFRLVPGVEFSVNNAAFKGATQVYTVTEVGYNFELTIPWDSLLLDFAPANGTQIGFDILASDNDATASDANRNQVTLFSKIDKPYNDPSLFGTLQFEGMGTFSIIPDVVLPGAASNLTATVLKNAVTLAWDNATDNIAILYYNVYQNGTLLTNKVYPKQTANTLKISALADGEYTFDLETVDNSWNVSETKVTVTATVLTTAVIELDAKLSVYPNPVSNVLNIKGIDNMKQIEVISLTGSVLKKQLGSETIDVSDLNRGVYFLKVHTDKEIFTTRFMKD